MGFEPTNNGFANHRVKPLHHGTLLYCANFLYQIYYLKANPILVKAGFFNPKNLYCVRLFYILYNQMKKIFKNLFKRKQKVSPKRIILMLLPFLIALGVYAVSTTDTPVVSKATTSNSSYLTYEKAVFATVDPEGEVVFRDENPSFIRGEAIHFALMNVGEFKTDKDGKCQVDMDLLVTGPDKKVVMDKKNLLGPSGHLQLEDNIAPSPSGVFIAGTDMKSGKYTMKLTVYDKIGGDEVSDSGSFTLR